MKSRRFAFVAVLVLVIVGCESIPVATGAALAAPPPQADQLTKAANHISDTLCSN